MVRDSLKPPVFSDDASNLNKSSASGKRVPGLQIKGVVTPSGSTKKRAPSLERGRKSIIANKSVSTGIKKRGKFVIKPIPNPLFQLNDIDDLGLDKVAVPDYINSRIVVNNVSLGLHDNDVLRYLILVVLWRRFLLTIPPWSLD